MLKILLILVVNVFSISPKLEVNYELMGGNTLALEQAKCFLDKYGSETFVGKKKISNKDHIVIQDLTKKGNQYRFYVLDLESSEVVAYPSAHGKGKKKKKNKKWFAKFVSNTNNSELTPIGFFVTGDVYKNRKKKWKYGIRLHGLEEGRNDKAYSRGIVVHSGLYRKGSYVSNKKVSSEISYDFEDRVPMMSGMSQGCTAVPPKYWNEIKKYLKKGTLFFVYNEELEAKGLDYCGENVRLKK